MEKGNSKSTAYESKINVKQRFETYVTGDFNRFATLAAQAVANDPGNIYNPFIVYGGAGLGKSHLLYAIGNTILTAKPYAKVKYMTAEVFTNTIINAIQTSTVKEFQDEVRTVDCLIIDDIQFLEDKERTQEEFFYTINALKEENRQIVIASNCHPLNMNLEERLCSRLVSGLIVEIKSPVLFERIGIIRKMAVTERIDVSDEVVRTMAQEFGQGFHMIVGEIKRIKAYADLMTLTGNRKG